jgi:hypothetical protein
MAQQLLSAGLALSSIWEKSRARDKQREVAGDKAQWGFVLQGMRPTVAQAAEWWQGAVLIITKDMMLGSRSMKNKQLQHTIIQMDS